MEIIIMGAKFPSPFKIKDDVIQLKTYDDLPGCRTMFQLELTYHDKLYRMLNKGDIFFTNNNPEYTITIDCVEAFTEKNMIIVLGYLNNSEVDRVVN